MDDKKLTDNEIVKALECCAEPVGINCIKCPLEKDCLEVNMCELALDLINRLQSEKEALINGQETLQKYLAEREAEVESWRKNCDELYEQMSERLKAELKIERRLAKAEAYKECIEKVKEEIAQALENNYNVRAERIEKHNVGETDEFISYCGGKIDCLRGLDDFLDNLLKELVGDK